ncbi:hypothetical protein HC030_16255 [Planosporangium mesophilum]|nr:hypothetical protein [Planosporangium mesophilum]
MVAGSAAVVPAAAGPAHADTGRVETPVSTSSPISSVVESVVRVKVPLPASAGPHPQACDWLSYLRFRHANGPARSAGADKILIAQPGILEGAGAFDSLARDTIVQAAGSGRYLEFWALDRRSNCLEDSTGLRAGLAARDPHVAIDYYYRHKEIDGRTFAGYLGNGQVGWLARVGLEQTVRDQYDLMVAELPDQGLRKQKVLCGGHSLGGVLTGFFAEWDFDGNPATVADAGYNQCSGYFALDSTIATSLSDLNGLRSTQMVPDPGIGYVAMQAGLDTGLLPRTISLPALINAETMNVLGLAGLAATVNPGGRSDLVTYLPSNVNLDTTQRLLFSKDHLTFLTGTPSTKDFNLTNQVALGALLDDNSQPLAFLQTSAGFFDGGRIVDKDFPVPYDVTRVAELRQLQGQFGTSRKAIPDSPHGPLYTWRNYNRVGAPDDPAYAGRDGAPFTTEAREVTDIQELARSLSEHPLDFTEHYFPTKLVTDIYQASSPQISRHVVHTGGIEANPTINLLGGEGLVVGNGTPAHGTTVIAPGYHHLDVLTAAPDQNGGRPELVSVNLAAFALSR